MTNELYTFVKESLGKGMDRAAIHAALAQAGWQEEEIKNALSAFAEVQFPIPVPKPKPYLQAREAFLYLVSFITLYITAFSFGVLVFAFIDKLLPDPLQFRGFFPRGLTTSLASLIVAFPLYLFMMRQLGKAAARDPERRQSKVGKWLTYITLVIAAGIIIGDLIAVLSNLLGGELTIRFVLKAFTILAITGSIFGYYLWSLQKEEKEEGEKGKQTVAQKNPSGVRIFVGAVVAAIVLVVGYGLILVGTPAQQRLIQFDERRVSDLQNISFAIDSYWGRTGTLPESLEVLQENPQYYYVPSVHDPKTGMFYEYSVYEDTIYELCAEFETDSSQQKEKYEGAQRAAIPASPAPFFEEGRKWEYSVGRTCFKRQIQESAATPEKPAFSIPVD